MAVFLLESSPAPGTAPISAGELAFRLEDGRLWHQPQPCQAGDGRQDAGPDRPRAVSAFGAEVVLAAFEVPEAEGASFEAFLSGLDYRFQLDENNDAYRRFLTA